MRVCMLKGPRYRINLFVSVLVVFALLPIPRADALIIIGPPTPYAATPDLDLTLFIDGKSVVGSSTINVSANVPLPVLVTVTPKPGGPADWWSKNLQNAFDGSVNSMTYWDAFYLDFYKGTLFSDATFISGEQMNASSTVLKRISSVSFPGPGTYSAVLYDSRTVRNYDVLCSTDPTLCDPASDTMQLQEIRAVFEKEGFYNPFPSGFIGIVTFTIKTDPCAVPGSCASNVLFLPGIEGSRLYRPDYQGGTDKLWEPTSDAGVQDLYMNADGTSARSDVYTKDVIDDAYFPIKENIYKSFLADLFSWKNTDHLIADYGVAPYDWRLSLDDILNNGNQLSGGRIYYSGDLRATSSPYIIQELRRLAKSSKTGKVTIVAHSNGGLVAKALTEKLGSEASTLIDKIIFVAVPQVGTPKAIGAILHGYDQGLPLDSFPIALSDETARTFAKNMPSAYNLLPSENYFTYVDDPVVTFDNSALLAPWRAKYGGEIHSKELLHTFIADQSRPPLPVSNDLYFPISGNETLLNNAETLHAASLDAWTPPQGIALTEIAGWGEKTPKTIAYYQGWKTSCSDPTDIYSCTDVPALEYKVKEVLDGDGTVVVPSALWTATATTTGKWWVDLESYGDTGFLHSTINRKHADILEVPTLRTLIQNILTGTNTALDFISTSTPPNSNPETRLRFTLHSPLALNLYDDLGNHTGFSTTTGFLEENIPGSRYQTYGELKYIEAPASTTLRLVMNGYTTGSFTLDIEKSQGDITLASTTFAGIPSSTTTTATITVPEEGDIAHATPLLVDYNGNGVADFSLKPQMGKTSIFDITPPEAILTFDPVSQKLNIIGTDNLFSTTVKTIATSTIITDEAGNTLEIAFKKFKQEKHEIKLELQELRYNGVVTTTQKTTLGYEWSTDKTGNIRELEEKATVGALKIEGHYDARKNVTRIEKKLKEEEDDDKGKTKETLPGLVIFSLTIDKGIITINY